MAQMVGGREGHGMYHRRGLGVQRLSDSTHMMAFNDLQLLPYIILEEIKTLAVTEVITRATGATEERAGPVGLESTYYIKK